VTSSTRKDDFITLISCLKKFRNRQQHQPNMFVLQVLFKNLHRERGLFYKLYLKNYIGREQIPPPRIK